MKEKINRFAKGIFEYEMPTILFKPQSLQLSVDAGETYHGSFLLSNNRKRMMKGIVCTDCHHLVFEEASFQGAENEIHFTFQGTYFLPGEVIKGGIRVLSDCGSALLPFSVTICVPSCTTSAGKIKDLLHFAKFAKENLSEAVRLFGSPSFEAIFQGQDGRWKSLYHGLVKGVDQGIAMEEFLIAIHKKLPVGLSVQNHHLRYKNCKEAFQDKFVLRKDTWGYCEYEIRVDARFVELEHHQLRTTDFVGDIYELAFVVHPDRMIGGRDFARITISNVRQTIEVDIIVDKEEYHSPLLQERIHRQQSVFRLYENFVSFLCKKKTNKEYCLAVEREVCNMDKLSEEQGKYDWLKRGFQIHMGIIAHLEESVTMQLGQLEENIEELFGSNPLLYCAYYYLLALFRPQEEVRAEAADKVRECYASRERHWLVLWFLLELDGQKQTVRKRQEMILEQLGCGCHSPLLYLKFCETCQEEPELLFELDAVRERCLHWGCCQGVLGRELQLRYTYLIGRQKRFSRLLLEDLCTIYRQAPSDDILVMICKMLMQDTGISRATRALREDFKWYALGIERNLKITDLYEHYIYAMEESADMELPTKVLAYFTYTNHLNASKKAMLYAYVIRHKDRDKKTYEAYCQTMRQFAMEQLSEGHISENLAVIYEEFINVETLDATIAKKLPEVLFAREITCFNVGITGVVVSHRELSQEEYVPLLQGRAVISAYTGNVQIFLVDARGNRYGEAVGYTSSQLLHLEFLAQKCLEYAGDDVRLLLHLYERTGGMNHAEADVSELQRRVAQIPRLEEDFKKKVFSSLVRGYFEHFEGELLDYQLEHMDWNQVDVADRRQFIEYCAIRHCHKKGMEGILAFGYDGMETKRLLQISADTFQRSLDREDIRLVKLAWYIFSKGQFDENMLRYLCDYFTGDTCDMIQVWKAADGFGIDVLNFSERILAQLVFLEEMVPEGYDVFYKYYEKGFNKKLNRAFLKMNAYQYMVKGRSIPEQMFDYFYKDVRVEENMPCLLAVLKYMSQKKVLTGQESIFADYNIHQLMEKSTVFGFYKDFYGKISLPERLLQEQCIEYIANPTSNVMIQYCIVSREKKGEYITETMRNVFEGIRVKTIVLFQDEVLQYRIVEVGRDGRKKQTGTMQLSCDRRIVESGSWYHMLNQMMLFRESEDATALINTMQEYAEKRETVRQLLKPLKQHV